MNLRVFAYGLASAVRSVQRMAGVRPATSPPISSGTFRPGWLEYRDLIMLKLHGEQGTSFWWGDDTAALSMAELQDVDLGGAIVFAENCWLPESPMLKALLEAGASAVVGGSGVNYGGTHTMAGADVLGLYFRRALQIGIKDPQNALAYAKLRLRLKWRTLATRDTLDFQLYVSGG